VCVCGGGGGGNGGGGGGGGGGGQLCVGLQTRKARVHIARKQARMMELKNGERDA